MGIKLKLKTDSETKPERKPEPSPSPNPNQKPAQPDTSRLLYGSGITKKTAATARAHFKKRDSLLAKLKQKKSPSAANQTAPVSPPPTDLADLDNAVASRRAAATMLDESQLHAVRGIIQEQYACLIGKAGTGKTTTAKAILYWLRKLDPELAINDIAICAFTGKAVQQIKLSIPREYHPCCSTIHALLEYAPVTEERYDPDTGNMTVRRVFKPQRTASHPLHHKLIIIDETGMLGTHLWEKLREATPPTTRILFMGDINQIPPVIGHSILGFAGLKWPVFTLETLHRNAGHIAENAHRIVDGKWPQENPACWRHVKLADSSSQAQTTVIGAVQALHKAGKFNPYTDAIITATNVGVLGQEALNAKLVHYFNPPQTVEGVCTNPRVVIDAGRNRPVFAVGDKVMLLANDNERGLTNGMTGIVTRIDPNTKYRGQATADQAIRHAANADLSFDDFADHVHAAVSGVGETDSADDETPETERQASHVVYVKFPDYDDEVSFSTAGDFRKIQLAYAFTCHKSQGSEYDTVVIVVHSTNAVMLTREWLYTAVTRAKKRVILLYNSRGLKLALHRQAIRGRTIKEKLESFNKLQETNKPANGDGEQFTLPEPFTLSIDDSLLESITAELPPEAC